MAYAALLCAPAAAGQSEGLSHKREGVTAKGRKGGGTVIAAVISCYFTRCLVNV